MILSADEIVKRLKGSGCIPETPEQCTSSTSTGGFRASSEPGGVAAIESREGRGLVISPYSGECLQPASYDLRAAHDTILARGTCTLVPTLEWVELPGDLAATLRCRSSYGRKGLMIAAGFVDPGFRGQLTLCLVNMGPEEIPLFVNNRVVQMIIHEVKSGNRLYEGRYQDSHGVIHSKEH